MNPADFEQILAQQGCNYDLLGGLDSPSCHLRFTGKFMGDFVIWDATLMSLTYYLHKLAIDGHSQPGARQFIEIGDDTRHGRQITIALDVPIIDRPTIVKTMIMVRQYKRMCPGRHEYGTTRKL